MNLDRVRMQNVDSDDFYYSLKSTCCSKSIQNIGQRSLTLRTIYDYCRNSGLDHDRVYITRHINGTGLAQLNHAWFSNLTKAQRV